jgi:hypothetical protein
VHSVSLNMLVQYLAGQSESKRLFQHLVVIDDWHLHKVTSYHAVAYHNI